MDEQALLERQHYRYRSTKQYRAKNNSDLERVYRFPQKDSNKPYPSIYAKETPITYKDSFLHPAPQYLYDNTSPIDNDRLPSQGSNARTFLLLLGFLNATLMFRGLGEYFVKQTPYLRENFFWGENSLILFLVFMKVFFFCLLIQLIRKTMHYDKNIKLKFNFSGLTRDFLFSFQLLLVALIFLFTYKTINTGLVEMKNQLFDNLHTIQTIDSIGTLVMVLLKFTLTCFITPIIEEIIFRGYLFQSIQSWLDKYNALWMTAIIFTLYHIPFLGVNTTLFFVLINGLFLGYIRAKQGNIIAPIIYHIVWNTLFYAIS